MIYWKNIIIFGIKLVIVWKKDWIANHIQKKNSENKLLNSALIIFSGNFVLKKDKKYYP